MKRVLLLAMLAVSACAPTTVNIPATAEVAICMTDAALPTSTVAATATHANIPAPPASPTPGLDIGSSQVRSIDDATMMYVPAGAFTMGYDQGNADEMPTHTLFLNAFWIDKTEVTIGMYAACVAAGKCKMLSSAQVSTQSPVINAPWEEASTYCSYVGARLATEAEWEKAARGTEERMYPWGMSMVDTKLTAFASEGALPPVGSTVDGASPYRVLDMAGSAFEWVADWYSGSYYVNSPQDNPTGPNTGSMHVIRGGWFEWSGGNNKTAGINITYRSTYRNGTGFYGRQLFGEESPRFGLCAGRRFPLRPGTIAIRYGTLLSTYIVNIGELEHDDKTLRADH